jgi:hypothetical protein
VHISNDFFLFPKEEQRKIYIATAYKLGVTPSIIEKDLWVCWALQQLFSMQLLFP